MNTIPYSYNCDLSITFGYFPERNAEYGNGTFGPCNDEFTAMSNKQLEVLLLKGISRSQIFLLVQVAVDIAYMNCSLSPRNAIYEY